MKSFVAFALTIVVSLSSAAGQADETPSPAGGEAPRPTVYHPDGDLFPTPGRLSTSAATGLPFLGIGEVGVGITRGIAIGVIGGITPSVLTAGLRPRFRVRLSDRLALMLVIPMLYYPSASAPGPGNIGSTSWVLARPELMLDGAVGARFHVAGGMRSLPPRPRLLSATSSKGKSSPCRRMAARAKTKWGSQVDCGTPSHSTPATR